MTPAFDPYHRWLGIRPEEQPADHYRLLGLVRFEDDAEVIRDAAERQIAHVRRNTLGAHAELARQLLNELGHAKACLTDHATKVVYDASLIGPSIASQPAVQAASKSDDRPAVPNVDLESQRRLIVKMYESQQWREANSLLEAMRKLTAPATVQYAKWAEQQLVSLHALLQQKQQAAAYVLGLARELFANHEYGEAAQKLLQVDKQLRTPEINELLDKAMELQEEVDQLIAQIEYGLRDRMRPGTLRNVQRLMELKPKDRVVRDLYRKFRWQERAGWLGLMLAGALALDHYKKSTPFHEEPLFRKWFALAAVVGLLAFGLTSWGLYRYLRRAEAARHARDVVFVEPEVKPNTVQATPPTRTMTPETERPTDVIAKLDTLNVPPETPETQLVITTPPSDGDAKRDEKSNTDQRKLGPPTPERLKELFAGISEVMIKLDRKPKNTYDLMVLKLAEEVLDRLGLKVIAESQEASAAVLTLSFATDKVESSYAFTLAAELKCRDGDSKEVSVWNHREEVARLRASALGNTPPSLLRNKVSSFYSVFVRDYTRATTEVDGTSAITSK